MAFGTVVARDVCGHRGFVVGKVSKLPTTCGMPGRLLHVSGSTQACRRRCIRRGVDRSDTISIHDGRFLIVPCASKGGEQGETVPSKQQPETAKKPKKTKQTTSRASQGKNNKNKKVIVIGGGFAGFAAAKHLAEQDGVDVQLLDANPNPGGLSTAFKSSQGRTIEAGVKGFWYDYPNINRLCDELEIQPFTDFLTSGFWARSESGRGAQLVTEAPVFSQKKPQLPTILGQFLYTSPLFYNKLSLEDRLTIIPWLYDVINFAKDQETYEQYDAMSAREMFKRAGVSDNAYEYFLKPTLAVGLFAPPEDLSAAVTLELLCFYALNSQNAFDVRWCKGPITEKIFTPLVERITELGGSIQGNTFVTNVRVEDQGQKSGVSIEARVGNTTETFDADAVIFALSISGMKKIVSNSPQLGCCPEFANIMNLRSIDCIATKVWFDKILPTRFPANVLADFEVCGATYFNTTEMQSQKEDEPGTVISADFYGASALLPRSDEDIIDTVVQNIRACDPVFRDAKVIDSAVVKFSNAVTHFSPGSYKNRPRQDTSFSNVFLAGDYVKDVPHGANGLSQERAWVTGLGAANLVLETLNTGQQATIIPSYQDEPHIALLKNLNESIPRPFDTLMSKF
ncbi:Phytoene dehydrogenase [Picochlorum sp. SENEW3]|nr:Phytoene dehydrogenase [Picochlorum sp. SENEW3]